MVKNWTKSEKQRILMLIKRKKLSLHRIKIYVGEYDESDVEESLDLILEQWRKISNNRLSVFFKLFLGFIRELIVEVYGDTCKPCLQLLCFGARGKKEIEELEYLVFLAFAKSTHNLSRTVPIKVEKISEEKVEQIIDNLDLPWIRIVEGNKKLEEILDNWQYNKQLSSRSGIVSRKSLELQMGMER